MSIFTLSSFYSVFILSFPSTAHRKSLQCASYDKTLYSFSFILFIIYSSYRPEAKQIVEGNRDVTLLLLWRLMYTFELKMMINSDAVCAEAAAIRDDDSWRRSIYGQADALGLAVDVPVRENDGVVTYPLERATQKSTEVINKK